MRKKEARDDASDNRVQEPDACHESTFVRPRKHREAEEKEERKGRQALWRARTRIRLFLKPESIKRQQTSENAKFCNSSP